jgi:ABC-type lipoprotein export system ATPase subunit
MLYLEGVTKTFTTPQRTTIKALSNISFSVSKGEFVAVQGPSGSGKTTLLFILGGLLQPSEGKVFVDGEELYLLPLEKRAWFRAQKIGFVFQEFYLIPYLNVLENILTPSLSSPLANAPEEAQKLISSLQLSARLDHKPEMLSTGERQRVALARALLKQPKVILADEPTGNLDTENAKRVLTALSEFTQRGGTVLLVTHSDEATEFAHRVLHLEQGKLIE